MNASPVPPAVTPITAAMHYNCDWGVLRREDDHGRQFNLKDEDVLPKAGAVAVEGKTTSFPQC